MKIIELYAEEFGCFTDRRFSFGDGLNIIEGENESGKSTLQALFRFLFYGFPRRAGADAEERDKRLSHKGRRAAGSITFTQGENTYFLHRNTVLRGSVRRESVSEDLSVVNIADGKPIELGDRTPGEIFLGMPWELYQNSFFVRQTELQSVVAPETSGILEDFLFQGGNSTRIDKAVDALTRARRELAYQRGRGGKIAELEDEKTRLEESMAKAASCARILHEKRNDMMRLNMTVSDLNKDISVLEQKQKAAKAAELLQRYDAWHKAKADEERALEAYQNALASTSSAVTPDEAFFTTVRDDISRVERAEAVLSMQENELERIKKSAVITKEGATAFIEDNGGPEGITEHVRFLSRKQILHALGAVLTGVLVLVCAYMGIDIWLFWIGAVALLPVCAFFAVFCRRTNKKKKIFLAKMGLSHKRELPAFLDQYRRMSEAMTLRRNETASREAGLSDAKAAYGAAVSRLFSTFEQKGLPRPASIIDAKQILVSLETQKRSCTQAHNELKHTFECAQSARKAHEASIDPAQEGALRKFYAACPPVEKSEAELVRELRFKIGSRDDALSRARNLEKEVAVLAASVQDMSMLRARHHEVEEDLVRFRRRLAAIQLASEALETAGAQVRGDVIPQVAKEASALFAKLVDDPKRVLLVENDFSVRVKDKGGVYPLSHFSTGCRDAAYLALRLALCHTVSEEILPLLFDEVTAHLDDKRAKKLLDVLAAYCQEGAQGLLFTCHTREASMLAGTNVSRITL